MLAKLAFQEKNYGCYVSDIVLSLHYLTFLRLQIFVGFNQPCIFILLYFISVTYVYAHMYVCNVCTCSKAGKLRLFDKL